MADADTQKPLPTYYIPHGGGPCFFMEWTMGPPDTWDKMADWLRHMKDGVGAVPKAIVVVSAHWEERKFSVTTAKAPPLLFDYYGFPESTYKLRYDAPGAPELAQRIRDLLEGAGFETGADAERGFDHGVFVPFLLIYPDAKIPVVQLSLKAGLDPGEHIKAGQALEPLRREGVLIVGSGMSYHNMRGFGRGTADSEVFDTWLTAAAEEKTVDARNDKLSRWAEAPAARRVHPREEHLIPMMVAAGAAGGDLGKRVFTDKVMAVQVSAYEFGGG
ncbi:MAG TPA: class III extradiol ring-cleavage dioxygenase [Magnetospirillaceae bacterium]|jgi:aromatic ring-opening dioxygenase catalytic subunit (LigB family)